MLISYPKLWQKIENLLKIQPEVETSYWLKVKTRVGSVENVHELVCFQVVKSVEVTEWKQ